MDFTELWLRHKAKVFIAVALLTIVLIVYYIANHSFISVNVENPSGSEITYTILDQKTNKSTVTKTRKSSIKKYVSRSQYEIQISDNSRNSWKEIDSGSFLRTKKVSSVLQKERERTFIANSPAGCMTNSVILLSMNCDGQLTSVKRHIPGTNDTPPVISEGIAGIDNNPEYINRTQAGIVAFYTVSDTGEFDEALSSIPKPKYYLALVQDDGQKALKVREISIDYTEQRHTLIPYKQGFIIYANDFSNIYYFASFDSEGEKIELPKTDSELKVQQLSVSNEYITLTYSNYSENKNNSTPSLQEGIKSEVFILNEKGSIKSYAFNTYWNNVLVCGTEKLCLLSIADDRNQVNVYDITSKKAKYLFAVNNAQDMFTNGLILKVINDEYILSLDVDKRSGAIDYTFKDSRFCGYAVSPKSQDYVLCITDLGSVNNAILIDSNKDVSYPIDVTVNKFIKEDYIDSVIPDRNRLYIIPNYGELVFVEGEGFTIDPEVKKSADSKIINLIRESKIKESGYTIINPGFGLY